MNGNNASSNLRQLLWLDAVTCLGMGLVLVVGAGWLAGLTGLPSALLVFAGALLFPSAALMAYTAGRADKPAPLMWMIIGGNVLWIAASLALMFGPWFTPGVTGQIFIGIQALAVAVLAGLEHVAWRDAGRFAAPA